MASLGAPGNVGHAPGAHNTSTLTPHAPSPHPHSQLDPSTNNTAGTGIGHGAGTTNKTAQAKSGRTASPPHTHTGGGPTAHEGLDDQQIAVDRQIRFYGILQALRKGRYPTNNQTISMLRRLFGVGPANVESVTHGVSQHAGTTSAGAPSADPTAMESHTSHRSHAPLLGIDPWTLSPESRIVVEDLQKIVQTVETIIEDKNADELIQKFLWHTRRASVVVGPDVADRTKEELGRAQGETNRDQIARDRDQAASHIRTLVTLFLTNTELRKILADTGIVSRDLLSKATKKAAGTLAPHEDRLRSVDEPVRTEEEGTAGKFVSFDEEGRRHEIGTDQTPSLGGQIPLPGTEGPDGHPDRARVHMDPRNDSAPGVQRDGIGDGYHHVPYRKEEIRDTAENLKGKGRTWAKEEKGGPPREKAQQQMNKARDYLSEEYFPKERRDQWIFRLKKSVLECQRHEDYEPSMRWLLDYTSKYARRAMELSGRHGQEMGNIIDDPNLRLALSELRTLLERFANNQSLDFVFDAINKLADDAHRDQNLRVWFEDIERYARRTLLESGFILSRECTDQGNDLIDRGRNFYHTTYKGHFDDLFNSLGDWFHSFSIDPLNSTLSSSITQLTRDLVFDSSGNLTIKRDIWRDFRRKIMPALIDRVGYVPIPRVEYTDDTWDLVIENLILQGKNMLPGVVDIDAHNYFKFSPYTATVGTAAEKGIEAGRGDIRFASGTGAGAAGREGSQGDHDDSDFFTSHRVTIKLTQMLADMKDVAFYYRKKGGLGRMTDSGLADVKIGGQGMSAVVTLNGSASDAHSMFKVQDVHVKVHELKFTIRDSKHDLLYKTVKPIAKRAIKKQIEKAMADMLRMGFEYGDSRLARVREGMQKTKEEDLKSDESRQKVLKEMFARNREESHTSSHDANTGEGLSPTSTRTSRTRSSSAQFKVVTDKRDSLLANAGHPAGWVNRLAEKDKLADKGTEWRSDAFTVV